MTAKQLLRAELRKTLKLLTPEYLQSNSERIAQSLLESKEYIEANSIAIFLSMPIEVNTSGIIQDALARGKICYAPRYEESMMDMLRIYNTRDLELLPRNKLNIQQPEYTVDESLTAQSCTNKSTIDNSQIPLSGTPKLIPRENPLLTGDLDLIIVPGLGFTAAGDRIGRGKGYYDKYLARLKEIYTENQWKLPSTIALTFPAQVVETIPTSPLDVRIDKVLF